MRVTARWSFLYFWLSYAGGATAILFGPAFSKLARVARPSGLAFAAALQVHIGLVVWLGVVTGRVPLQGGLLWFFLIALLFADLLVLLSFGIGISSLGRLWRPVLLAGTTYILIAFGRDFVLGVLEVKAWSWVYARRVRAVRAVEPCRNSAAPSRAASTAHHSAFRPADGRTRPGASALDDAALDDDRGADIFRTARFAIVRRRSSTGRQPDQGRGADLWFARQRGDGQCPATEHPRRGPGPPRFWRAAFRLPGYRRFRTRSGT